MNSRYPWFHSTWGTPYFNRFESDGNMRYQLPLPGYLKQNIEVSVEDDLLIIEATGASSNVEFAYHGFDTSVDRKYSIHVGKVKPKSASYINGILEIEVEPDKKSQHKIKVR